jgi:hypothetical protein
MKIFALLFVFLGLIGCTKSEDKSRSTPDVVDVTFNLESSELELNFDIVNFKSSKIKTLKILNNTNSDSSSLVPLISGVDEDSFSIIYQNGCDRVLKPLEFCILKVALINNIANKLSFNAQLSIDNLIIDLIGQSSNVTSSLNFELNQSPVSQINFGVVSNSIVYKYVNLKNRSLIEESLNSVSLNNTHFQILQDGCSNKVLKPNESCKLILSFDARQKEDSLYSGILTINNKNLNLLSSVSGGLVSNPVTDIEFLEGTNSVENINLGNNLTAKLKTVIVKNTGNTTIENPSPQFSNSDLSLVFSSCNSPLHPGRSCLIKVYFNPLVKPSGSYQSIISVANKSLVMEADKRPIITQANLTGPANRLFDKYYTAQKLGDEIIPEVDYSFDEPDLINKFSKNSDCSNAVDISNFSLNPNQLNQIYTQVETLSGVKSDCEFVGELVHDDIAPSIAFSHSGIIQLNEPGESANHKFNYTINDSNKLEMHKKEVFESEVCENFTNPEINNQESKNLNLNIRNYKSLLVEAEDRAGNKTVQCSYAVTFGHPHELVLSGANAESIDALGNKNFTAQVKDVFGNDLKNLDVQFSSLSENKIVNTGISSTASIEVSSNPLYSGSGLKYLATNGNINNILEAKHLLSNKSSVKNIKIVRRSCSELLHFDGVSSDGNYSIDLDGLGIQEPVDVFCDMAGGGWMRLDDSLGYQVGKNCATGYGTVDVEGFWDLMAKPQANSVNTSKGACGISSLENITMEEIKVESASLLSNNTCSSLNYPEPQIQIVKANNVANYSSLPSELSGYDFASASGGSQTIFSRKLSEGLSNGTYSFNEGVYKIHFASKAEERMSQTNVTHNNGNVTNKLMFTLLDDIVAGESSVKYTMTTGWISHSSTMTLRNASATSLWTGGRTRNNGSFSTVDEYFANLTNAGKNSYFSLTSSASVWNNGNGNHAADRLDIDIKYNTCINKPVSAKLWTRTGAYVYPKNCLHAQLRNPSLVNSGTDVLTTIDIDGVNGPTDPAQVLCDFNTDGGGWTNLSANIGSFNQVFSASSSISSGSKTARNLSDLGISTSSNSSSPVGGSLISQASDSNGGCLGYIRYLELTPTLLNLFKPSQVMLKAKSYGTGSHSCGGLLRYSDLNFSVNPLVRLNPTNFDVRTLGRCDGNGSYVSTSNSSNLWFYTSFNNTNFSTAKTIGALEAQCGSGTSYIQFQQVWIR